MSNTSHSSSHNLGRYGIFSGIFFYSPSVDKNVDYYERGVYRYHTRKSYSHNLVFHSLFTFFLLASHRTYISGDNVRLGFRYQETSDSYFHHRG